MQRNFIVLVIVLFIASVDIYGQKIDSKVEDEAMIRANIKQMEWGWNTHDGKAFAAPFADDADYVVVNGMLAKGKDAIEKGHIGIFTTIYKDSRNVATIKSIRFIRKDVAIIHTEWNLEFTAGGETRKGHALSTMIMTKDNEKWSISAFQNTPIQQTGGK